MAVALIDVYVAVTSKLDCALVLVFLDKTCCAYAVSVPTWACAGICVDGDARHCRGVGTDAAIHTWIAGTLDNVNIADASCRHSTWIGVLCNKIIQADPGRESGDTGARKRVCGNKIIN